MFNQENNYDLPPLSTDLLSCIDYHQESNSYAAQTEEFDLFSGFKETEHSTIKSLFDDFDLSYPEQGYINDAEHL